MGTELLPWVFTSGWASGINAYAVVFIMGIMGRYFGVDAIPGALTRMDVMAVALVLTLLELFADKIPYVDSAWDAVHTVIRPAVAATVGYLLAGHEGSSLEAAFAAATGGFAALASHAVKAGIRAGVNTSPEPASNVVVSSAENVAVVAVMSLVADHPWLAASIAAFLLLVGIIVVMLVIRRFAGVKRRYDDWGRSKLGGAADYLSPTDPAPAERAPLRLDDDRRRPRD